MVAGEVVAGAVVDVAVVAGAVVGAGAVAVGVAFAGASLSEVRASASRAMLQVVTVAVAHSTDVARAARAALKVARVGREEEGASS
ncbi:hypothetical protein [Nannocystis pusilla]|uniref:hypothetical protein n=1 Tax=Nannocystis pusilla TaxID=889268 RepID=UPI003B7BC068